MNYTYVLKSLKDGKLYIGWTNNLKKRFDNHSLGKVFSTKDRRPLDLIYYEACLDKDFNCADMFILLDVSTLAGRYAQRFLKTA